MSIIIPFRDEPALLATCAASLRQDPGYEQRRAGARRQRQRAARDGRAARPALEGAGRAPSSTPRVRSTGRRSTTPRRPTPGARSCSSPTTTSRRAPAAGSTRCSAMRLRDEVGAVGARLLYPDGAIQHAGVVVGLGGIAGHVLRGLPGDHPGYNSMAISTRNCSVVTGACMMVRREVFESVGGFDERLPVAFNDVDFCLKLRERGYLVVYTPLAELDPPRVEEPGPHRRPRRGAAHRPPLGRRARRRRPLFERAPQPLAILVPLVDRSGGRPMEDLPGDVRVDTRVVVEHLRSVVGSAPGAYPRTWLPQATFDELLGPGGPRADPPPPEPAPPPPPLGHGPCPDPCRQRLGTEGDRAAHPRPHRERRPRPVLHRGAGVPRRPRPVDRRASPIASTRSRAADLRNLLDVVRNDLLDLSRYVDDRIDTRLSDTRASDA